MTDPSPEFIALWWKMWLQCFAFTGFFGGVICMFIGFSGSLGIRRGPDDPDLFRGTEKHWWGAVKRIREDR
jgi:hypothetical protein